VSVTEISGGSGSNVIPDRCSITVGRRVVPGEDPGKVLAQLGTIAREACPLDCEVTSLLPTTPDGQPGSSAFYQPVDSALITFLADLCGTTPTIAPYGTNALRYAGLAQEVVVFGPGSIDHAHQATEHVAIADLVRVAEVLSHWLAPG
jgi:acetylornithine deacetylase/succinyl-diaminopimelate desuccinylase-like protein